MSEGIKKAYKIFFKKFICGDDNNSSPKLLIPDFQRNFVWPKKNIEKFLNSIIDNEEPFYIGNLVIQDGIGAGGRDRIIDGQQRLVTLAFILKSITELTKNEQDIKTIKDLLFISPSYSTPRLDFSRPGMDKVYKDILTNKNIDLNKIEDKILRNFVRTYYLIRKLVASKYNQELFKKIIGLQLVIVRCSSAHNVVTLYEGLNSTSKRLKSLELIKSFIVSESSSNHSLWQRIEGNFSKKSPIWFEKFIRSHWFSIDGYVSNEQLYDKVRAKFKNDNRQYRKELEYYSDIYISLRDADFKERQEPWKAMRSRHEIRYLLKGIRDLRLDQVYAPLIALLKYGMSNKYYLTNTLFFDDLFKIWNFLLLFKFSDSNPNKVERKFANFCKKICNNFCKKIKFLSIQNNFYRSLKDIIPSKPVFSKNLLKEIRYSAKSDNNLSNKNLVESLLAIYLLKDEERIIPETCDIEHIFPEGNDWNDWNITSKAKYKLVDYGLRYSLGNLTLLTPKRNSRAKNKNFDYKYKNIYSKDRKFVKNKELKSYYSYFNSRNPSFGVEKRGKDISNCLYDMLSNNLQ